MGRNQQADELPPVRRVPPSRVLTWVRLGWRDFLAAGWPSLLHGLLVFIVSILILQVGLFYWPILPAAISGFLLIGPMMATGLYALSQRLERGQKPQLADAIAAWCTSSKCLLPFGLLLIMLGVLWVLATVLLFYLFVPVTISGPLNFLKYVLVQRPEHFMLWTLLGGLGAALVFGLTVISIPLLLDRDIKTWPAMMASMRAVGENPTTMAIWATLIVVATGVSVATMMLGFIVLYPVMGHASWHVYRDLLDGEPSDTSGSSE